LFHFIKKSHEKYEHIKKVVNMTGDAETFSDYYIQEGKKRSE